MADTDGKISARGWIKGIQEMQLDLSQADISAVFGALDINKDGSLEVGHLCPHLSYSGTKPLSSLSLLALSSSKDS